MNKVIPIDEQWAMPALETMSGKKVIELGNKKNANGLYRDDYTAAGMDYTCIDWNSEDGAVNLDLGKLLPDECIYVGKADLVTNFGFSEHVFTNQEVCWENIARLSSKYACYLAIVLPTPGHWEHHGVYQPPLSWLEDWCRRNGYEIRTAVTNKDRRRHVNVIGARRLAKWDPFEYSCPPISDMHITPPSKRVNMAEKNCGISP